GAGKIYKHGKDSLQYRVDSIKDLQVIIDHFVANAGEGPLLRNEQIMSYLKKHVPINCINEKEYLTTEELYKIVSIKASMNLGLPGSRHRRDKSSFYKYCSSRKTF